MTDTNDTTTEPGGTLPKLPASKRAERGKRGGTVKLEQLDPGTSVMIIDGSAYLMPTSFTGRELTYLQELTGVRLAELDESANAGDVQVLLAMAVIILRRAGNEDVTIENLMDHEFGSDPGPGTIVVAVVTEDDAEGGARPTSASGSSKRKRASGSRGGKTGSPR